MISACVSATEDTEGDVTLEDDLGKSREGSRTDDDAVRRCVLYNNIIPMYRYR